MPENWVPPNWVKWSALVVFGVVDALVICNVISLTVAFWIIGPIAGALILAVGLKSR